MKRTTIYLPDNLHRALRREALEQEITMAEVIRRMSEFYLKRGEIFWETVDRLRQRNEGARPDRVDQDVLEAVRELRGRKRPKKRSRTR